MSALVWNLKVLVLLEPLDFVGKRGTLFIARRDAHTLIIFFILSGLRRRNGMVRCQLGVIPGYRPISDRADAASPGSFFACCNARIYQLFIPTRLGCAAPVIRTFKSFE